MMALDASWLLNDARSPLAGTDDDLSIADRIVFSLPEPAQAEADRAQPRGSLLKRATRLGIRATCAAQLRLYRLWFRMTLREVGPGCVFASGLIVQGHDKISLGSNVRVNDYAFLQCGGESELIIGDDVTISIGAKVMTGQYPVGPSGHDRSTHVYETVVIEDGAWIGAGAVILPGVRIGRRSIVAAGAVVSKNVPCGVLVAGAPAKVIRRLSEPPRHDEFLGSDRTEQPRLLKAAGA